MFLACFQWKGCYHFCPSDSNALANVTLQKGRLATYLGLLHLRNRQSPCGVQQEASRYCVGLVNCKVARLDPRADKVKICRSAPERGS